MGVVVVEKSSTGNPATEGPAAKATAVKEEAEIKEIICPKVETTVPYCVHVIRRWGDEWVFYEEDHSDWAIHKL
jgi:hypothetical protein